MRLVTLALLSIVYITGCDVDLREILPNETPFVPMSMNKGIVLQISDTQTAAITGRDKCPDESIGCIDLSGKKHVTVTVHVDGERPFEESWTVEESGNGKRVRLIRPNDWVLYQPNANNTSN